MKKSWKKRVGIALLLSASLMLAALPVAAEDPAEEVQLQEAYDDYLAEEGEGDEALADSEENEAFLGQTTTELVFYPLTPCRIVDTRIASRWGFNPIASGGQINLDVYGNTSSQGGAVNCGVNSDAAGVVINVTAIPVAGGDGFLTVWPFGTARPLAALVNYNPADAFAIGNATVQTIRRLGADQLSVYALRAAHVTIDVSGYFRRPSDTELERTIPTNSRTLVRAGGFGAISVACPAGYGITGGGCTLGHYSSLMVITTTFPSGNGWRCDGINEHPVTTTTLRAYAICSRTPGF